jgi:alpha/beta hydrolase family protein
MPSWYENTVRRYEQMRFDQEGERRTLPFAWGVEHIGGDAHDPDPQAYLERYVADALAQSDAWYASEPASDYVLADNVITFSSAIASPWPENNRVHAQFFPTRRRSPNHTRGPAVVVLAQWNAKWHEQQNVCLWLNTRGLTAVKMSLPYHDRRAIPEHPRADYLVGPNIGLTMQAGRQAVLDVRRTLRWLEREGFGPLGILGTSIGSAIGFITMCHEPAVEACAFLHASTYFGDVVATGLTTKTVWDPISAAGVTHDQLRRYWSPISPFPYIGRLPQARKRLLLITAKYDPTFWPEYTEALVGKLRGENVGFERMSLPCGHYSLGVKPFSWLAGHRFGKFLGKSLRK